MKSRNPATAAVLNVIFPGLGCAYLRRWWYALAYLIWVPLALLVSLALADLLASLLADQQTQRIVYRLVLLLLWIRILHDQASTPYRLAKEMNRGING